MKLYISTNGIYHVVLGGYICNTAIGKVQSNYDGLKAEVTCKNCKLRFSQW